MSYAERARSKTQKSGGPTGTIIRLGILAAVLVVGGVLIMREQGIRSDFNASREAIDQAMDQAEAAGEEHTIDQLRTLLQGSPTRHSLGEGKDQYLWEGTLQNYTMVAEYEDDGFVTRVKWN